MMNAHFRNCCWTVVMTLIGAPLLADVPEPPDPTELDLAELEAQSQWVQRTRSASALLSGGSVAEALEAFVALDRDLPEQDTNGLVAVTIGDCYLRLDQYEQAQRQYESVVRTHPEVGQGMWLRLVEVDLASDKLDSAEGRLSEALAGALSRAQRTWALWRLAAVQERRAIDRIRQASDMYRKAAQDVGGDIMRRARHWGKLHAADLEDAASQLDVALQELERRARQVPDFADPTALASGPTVAVNRAELTGTVSKSQTQERLVQVSLDEDGGIEVKVDEVAVELGEDIKRQITKHLRHVVRISDTQD